MAAMNPSPIPKILHQLWIGPKPAPTKFMDTWKVKHPDWEYIRWSEAELEARGMSLACQKQIEGMREINGKADIIRWEILNRFGGVFVDADSICIEPLDGLLEAHPNMTAFAGYENEEARGTLIATGTMGFTPNHPLVRAAIEWIQQNLQPQPETHTDGSTRAWYTVGPGLITRLYETKAFKDLTIFPSYTFLPFHYTGRKYEGHAKVYTYQEWGSTKQNYDIMNSLDLPEELREPQASDWVSVLICSKDAKASYVKQCLDSMRAQQGRFGMEVVWVNDGSSDMHSRILEGQLQAFERSCRWVKVRYEKLPDNVGIGPALNHGLPLCTHDIVFRMDSDDIMEPHRIRTQLAFMKAHGVRWCGSNMTFFRDVPTVPVPAPTRFPLVQTWAAYHANPKDWIANHPCMAFYKADALDVGNYDMNRLLPEDLDLWLRLLKLHGSLHTVQQNLLKYRLHPDQFTAYIVKDPVLAKQRVQTVIARYL